MIIVKIYEFMYNTMMSRITLQLALSLALMLPMQAHAYLSPEDVLYDDSGIYVAPPPNARSAADVQRAQQERSAARRQAEWEALFADQEDEEEPVHAAAPEEPAEEDEQTQLEAILQKLSELEEAENSDESRREERILERIEEEQLRQRYGLSNGGQVLGGNEVLHSGAPLSDTGPGLILSLVTLLGASAWTLWKARKLEARAR